MQTPEAFIVGHSTVSSAQRVARNQSLLKRSFLSLGLILVIVVVLQFTTPDGWTPVAVIRALIPALVLWGAFLAWRLVALRNARRDLAAVGTGEAFRIDHSGITIAGQPAPVDWSAIQQLKVEGALRGAGPELILDHTRGSYRIPISFLDTLPGTIDSALRAYSGARRGLDLSNLDSVNVFG